MKAGRERAFTLIEMLVVITVIGVVLAIALPALRGARSASQRASCLSNLHSLGQAFQMYRGDYKNLLPYAEREVDVRLGYLDPLTALARYTDVAAPSLDENVQVRTGAPWACPADSDTASQSGTSYFYTPLDLMILWSSRGTAQRLTTAYLDSDPTTVLMMDLEAWHPPGPMPPPSVMGTNVLRMDGGAEAGREGLSISPRR